MNMRGLAAFAGGAAAAFFAARILPPFLAQASGTVRAAAGRDPFDMLANDHRIILALLEEMEHSPDNATFSRMQKLLTVKRRLSAHALAEEDVIYPMLHDTAGAVSDARGDVRDAVTAPEPANTVWSWWTPDEQHVGDLVHVHRTDFPITEYF